jgi:AsmA protein
MQRFIRYALIALLVAVTLLSIVLGYLITKLDADTVVPLLQQQLKQATGLELRIDGDFNWSIFPSLQVEIGDLALHTQSAYKGDTLFAQVDSIALGISWAKLLDRELRFESLSITDGKLRLIKPAGVNGNWQALANSEPNTGTKAQSPPAQAQNVAALALVFEVLTLEKITVEYHDLGTAESHQLQLDYLHASQIALDGQPFDLALTLQYLNSNTLQAQLKLDGSLAVDVNAQSMNLSVINGKFDNSLFNGDIAVTNNGGAIAVAASLRVDQINFNDYQGDDKQSTATAASPIDTATTSGSSPVLALLALPNAKLDLAISQLKHRNVQFNNITAKAEVNDGYIKLAPVRADVFGGNVTATLSLDANASPPVLRVNSALNGIQIDSALSGLDMPPDMSGVAAVNADVTMRGASTDQWLRSLSGSTNASISNGRYHKDNIEHRVCQAIALARNEKLQRQWSNETEFNTANVIVKWRDGIGEITSLSGGLDNMQLVGRGDVSAINQTVDLRLRATITGDLADKDPGCVINAQYRNIAWPIRCTANAETSQCGIDNSELDKLIRKTLQEKLQQVINKNVDKELGDELSETLRQLFK